jgi:hypothetical protein
MDKQTMPSKNALVIENLLRYIAGYPDTPPRTVALEQEIRIGTGFHGKWYRSQKEHWLGYVGYKRALWAAQGKNYNLERAQGHWSRTHCFPMLFWLAECAGVDSIILETAEVAARRVAAVTGSDHPSHGKAAREVLPWLLVQRAILSKEPELELAEAHLASDTAYTRLASLRSDCRV